MGELAAAAGAARWCGVHWFDRISCEAKLMGWRSTIIMCVLAALAVLALWLVRTESATVARDMTTRPLLDRTDLPRDGVTEVSIIDADGAGTPTSARPTAGG